MSIEALLLFQKNDLPDLPGPFMRYGITTYPRLLKSLQIHKIAYFDSLPIPPRLE